MRRNIAVGGAAASAAAVIAGIAVALAGGQSAPAPVDTTPAGQVEVVTDSSTTVPPTTTPVPAKPAAPARRAVPQVEKADTGDVNQPLPADEAPEIAPDNPNTEVPQAPAPPPPDTRNENVPLEHPRDVYTPPNQIPAPTSGTD